MKQILIIFGIVSVVLGAAIVGSYIHLFSPPEFTPADYIDSRESDSFEKRLVIVCAGDSITHGHVSSSYIAMLRERFGDTAYVINAGVNSSVAYNVLTRVDEVVACSPDIVTVLVGTNDANKSYDPVMAEKAVDDLGLPNLPSAGEYERYLTEIVRQLKQRTDAKIATISPPPIGENPRGAMYTQSEKFAGIAREVASSQLVTYLPLFEELDKRIEPIDRDLKPAEAMGLMYGSIVRHYLLGYSFDRIAKKNGYAFHTDELHLNSAGATIIADLIYGFVEGNK